MVYLQCNYRPDVDQGAEDKKATKILKRKDGVQKRRKKKVKADSDSLLPVWLLCFFFF
jgi:hypothetical protein